jgi:cell division transport system permease protein
MWYGLLGGLLAWMLILIALLLLDGPVERLSMLYQSRFELSGPGIDSTFFLFIFSAFLGWIGSWIAVGKHLSAIEPT